MRLLGAIAALLYWSLGLGSPAAAKVPTDGWVIWASDRADGRHEIYRAKADGSEVTRLTTEGGKGASWSPDGAWIAYTRITDSAAQVMRPDGSDKRTVCEPGSLSWFWMLDGSGLVCGRTDDTFYLADPVSGTNRLLFRRTDFPQLGVVLWPGGITRDGRYLVATTDRINTTYTYENGTYYTPLAASVLLDFTQPEKIYFIGPGCEPSLSLQDDLVVHVSWAAETLPDLYRMNLKDIMSRSSYAPEVQNPDADWGHEYMPRISNDGNWLAYGATTGCHDHETCDYELFIHQLGAGPSSRTRVTYDAANDQWPHLYVGKLWPPELQLWPSALAISVEQGVQAAVTETVAVRNEAGGTLPPVSTKITYLDGSDWLQVTQNGSGNEQTLGHLVNTLGLQLGQYRATVEVSASEAANSPQSYQVVLEVRAPSPTPPLPGTSGCSAGADSALTTGLLLAVAALLFPVSFSVVAARKRGR